MRRAQLVIMVKEPRPGRVKTRLGRDLGMVTAAWWFRHKSRALIRRLDDPRWDLILAVTPDTEGMTSRVWPGHVSKIPQGRGYLGQRMKRIFGARHSGPVCIIGSDIPGITKTHIADAFQKLGSHHAVFGPAYDGGYWLIGLSGRCGLSPGLFEGVRWSTEFALEDTIASLNIAADKIGYLPFLRDVDELKDLYETR